MYFFFFKSFEVCIGRDDRTESSTRIVVAFCAPSFGVRSKQFDERSLSRIVLLFLFLPFLLLFFEKVRRLFVLYIKYHAYTNYGLISKRRRESNITFRWRKTSIFLFFSTRLFYYSKHERNLRNWWLLLAFVTNENPFILGKTGWKRRDHAHFHAILFYYLEGGGRIFFSSSMEPRTMQNGKIIRLKK